VIFYFYLFICDVNLANFVTRKWGFYFILNIIIIIIYYYYLNKFYLFGVRGGYKLAEFCYKKIMIYLFFGCKNLPNFITRKS